MNYRLNQKLVLANRQSNNRDFGGYRQMIVKNRIVFKLKNIYFELQSSIALSSFVMTIALNVETINDEKLICMDIESGNSLLLLDNIVIRADILKGDLQESSATIIFYKKNSCEQFIKTVKYFKEMNIGPGTAFWSAIDTLTLSSEIQAVIKQHVLPNVPNIDYWGKKLSKIMPDRVANLFTR